MNLLGDGKRKLVPMGVTPLPMRRNGIMNQSLNTPLEQIGLKMVTMAAEQGEDMKNIIGKIIGTVSLGLQIWAIYFDAIACLRRLSASR